MKRPRPSFLSQPSRSQEPGLTLLSIRTRRSYLNTNFPQTTRMSYGMILIWSLMAVSMFFTLASSLPVSQSHIQDIETRYPLRAAILSRTLTAPRHRRAPRYEKTHLVWWCLRNVARCRKFMNSESEENNVVDI
ncbi:hypothetical protein ScPMuIL_017843 [Solemya velum]